MIRYRGAPFSFQLKESDVDVWAVDFRPVGTSVLEDEADLVLTETAEEYGDRLVPSFSIVRTLA